MMQTLKGCLIAFIVLFLIAFGTIVYFFSSGSRIEQAKIDRVEQSLLCDTIPYITEQPKIEFAGFSHNEVGILRFQILRNGTFIRDTTLQNAFTYISDDRTYKSLEIPYDYFLKTDTIVVTTKSQLYFYISGYHHYAHLYYATGYLGTHSCRLSKNCNVNGESYSPYGVLAKEYGWIDPKNPPVKIYEDTPEFALFESQATIKFEEAKRIAYSHNESPPFLFCENSCYVFIERDYEKWGVIIKVNAQTGVCTRHKNYPHDS